MPAYPSYPLSLPVRNGALLPGVCFRTEQQRLNAFSSVQYVEVPSGFAGIIISPNTPTVEQQSFLWVKSDAFNNPIQQFIFSSQFGAWVWNHPWDADDPRMVLYTGNSGDVALLDGGDAGAITATTGAFWRIDTEFTDRLPVGAGTIPEGTDANKFAAGTAYPALRGVFFIRRTSRQYLTP